MKLFKIFLLIFFFVGISFLNSCKNNPIVNNPPRLGIDFDFRLTDFDPAWSPDGKTIAYVHGDTLNGKTGIYLIDTSGNNKRIIYVSARAYSPTWSPDDHWIAFSDNAQIFKMKINGDSLTQLTYMGRNFFPDWSPDGKWIAYNESVCYSSNTCGIWLMQSAGTQHNFLVAYGNFPDWHRSEKKILYLTRAITSKGEAIGDSLWTFDISLNTKSFLFLLSGKNFNNRNPKYSPDGTKIAFTSQAEGNTPQIWVMNSDGSNLKQLTNTQGYSCDWSPDGSHIVYTDSRNVNGSLWLMKSDGSNKKQLTFN